MSKGGSSNEPTAFDAVETEGNDPSSEKCFPKTSTGLVGYLSRSELFQPTGNSEQRFFCLEIVVKTLSNYLAT